MSLSANSICSRESPDGKSGWVTLPCCNRGSDGRARAREDWQEHAGSRAAVIAGDEEIAALLAARHVQNAAAAFRAQTATDEAAD